MNGRVLGVATAVVIALAAIGLKLAADAKRPRGADAEQLRRMLLEGEAAAERRSASGVNRLISKDYRDEMFTDTQVRYQVGDFLRRHPVIEITIPTESVLIDIDPSGKSGTVTFTMSLTTRDAESTSTSRHSLTLHVAKEAVRYYWLFAGEEWRVVSASGYEGMEP